MPDPETNVSGAGMPDGSMPGPSYDRMVQQLIPGYTSLARLAVALLSASPLASARGTNVLVAGCGTGAELVEAHAQRPDWRITASDPSAAMLAQARHRLGDPGAIDWRPSRVEDLEFDQGFDGALAVLVLQSLPDDGSKLHFLTALARALRPGGQLVLVDLMQPERSPLQGQVEAAWHLFQRASGLAATDREIHSLSQLHPIGQSRLTSLVNAAGFGDPAPVFKALDFEGFLLQRQL